VPLVPTRASVKTINADIISYSPMVSENLAQSSSGFLYFHSHEDSLFDRYFSQNSSMFLSLYYLLIDR
jgi:hypothetical protein